MDKEKKRLEIDVLTLAAISIVAWALVVIMHEIVGHAGFAAIMGIPVRAVSTTTVFLEWDKIKTIEEYRLIHIGGTLMNLLTGVIAIFLLHYVDRFSKSMRYFLWLFATMSFVVVIMYLISATAIGAGDWMEVITDLEPKNLYVAMIVCIGILIAIPGYILPLRVWMPDLRGNRSTLLKVTVIPVLVLIIIQTLSVLGSPFAFYPPELSHLGASIFIFIHFILWIILVNVIPVSQASKELEGIGLDRSSHWLVAGVVVLIVFVFILGPGLGPLAEDPRLG
jgi:hypothetical protein